MLSLGKLLDLTLAGREPTEKIQLTAAGVRLHWLAEGALEVSPLKAEDAGLDLLLSACSTASSARVLVSHDRRIAGRFDRQLSLPEIMRAISRRCSSGSRSTAFVAVRPLDTVFTIL